MTAIQPHQYRHVDYFAAAAQLFLDELAHEYRAQFGGDGAPKKRFTWRNTGALAIHFALACDCAKLLCDRLVVNPGNITFNFEKAFAPAFFDYLIDASRVPSDVLAAATYLIKFKDWQKGGTRYTGTADAESVSNVQFPSAMERRQLMESKIRGGANMVIQSTIVTAEVATGRTISAVVAAAGSDASAASAASSRGSSVAQSDAGARAPAGTTSIKSIVPAARTNPWRQAIIRFLDGSVQFPSEKIGLMEGFVRLAEQASDSTDRHYILRVLANSQQSAVVMAAFEAKRGAVVFRDWVLRAVAKGDWGFVDFVLQFVARSFARFSPATIEAWTGPAPALNLAPAAAATQKPDDEAALAGAAAPPSDAAPAESAFDILRAAMATAAQGPSKSTPEHLTQIENRMRGTEIVAAGLPRAGVAAGGREPPVAQQPRRFQPPGPSPQALADQQRALHSIALQRYYTSVGRSLRSDDEPLFSAYPPRLHASRNEDLPVELALLEERCGSGSDAGGRATWIIGLGPDGGSDAEDADDAGAADVTPLAAGEAATLRRALTEYVCKRQFAICEHLAATGGFSFGEIMTSGSRSESNPAPAWYNPYDIVAGTAAWTSVASPSGQSE